MKMFVVVAAAGFLAAVSGQALAGQPDHPGADSAKDSVAAAKDAGTTLGQANQAADPNGPNFGQGRKFGDEGDARPNSGNDKGKGNNW